MISESTTQERTDDTGESVRGTDDTGKGGALARGRGEGDDGVSTGTETSSTKTGNGTAGNEGFSVGSGAANDGAKLEDEDGDEERSLEWEVLVDFTPCGGVSKWKVRWNRVQLKSGEGDTYTLTGMHQRS